MLPSRLLAVLVVALVACTSHDTPAAPAAPAARADAARPPDRATAAGLTAAQANQLNALGIPVAVPVLPDGWTFEALVATRGNGPGLGAPEYALSYRNRRGACLTVEAATEGIGDVFTTEPPAQRTVDVLGLATGRPVPMGWSGPVAGTAEGWTEARMQTEWFGADGVAFTVRSEATDACRRTRLEAFAAVLASLRYLDPRDDGPPGSWAWTDFVGGATSATPEAAARAAFDPNRSGESAQPTVVETIHQRPDHAIVLVTSTGLADDSVRDERTRVALVRWADGGWSAAGAVGQVRCQEGRGHRDWSAERCQ